MNRSQPHAFLPNLASLQAVFLLVILAELLALVLAVTAQGIVPFPWQSLGMLSLLIQWITLLSASVLTLAAPQLAQRASLVAGFISYGLVLLVIMVSAWGSLWVMPELSGSAVKQVANICFCGAIIGGVVLRYLHLQQQLSIQKQAELQARIEALQARIRPHFLFNSMNAIASLIESRPQQAEQMVVDLARLFRASLAEPGLIPLSEELLICRHYLAIEQVRLGERLAVEWHLDERLSTCPIPSLLLQPLVENAVYHGIQPNPEGGKVTIVTAQTGKQLDITITNPLVNQQQRQSTGNRMALNNITHRLQALYGQQATLTCGPVAGYFVSRICLPITTMPIKTMPIKTMPIKNSAD